MRQRVPSLQQSVCAQPAVWVLAQRAALPGGLRVLDGQHLLVQVHMSHARRQSPVLQCIVPCWPPCTPSVGVQVSSSGFYTMVTTDFGLRVKFDGNHRVEVTLPSTFGQKVCGMCGNYNGMAADDFLNPDGVQEPDSTSLGNSWQVSNDSR